MTDTKLTPAEIAALSNAELDEYVAKLCGKPRERRWPKHPEWLESDFGGWICARCGIYAEEKRYTPEECVLYADNSAYAASIDAQQAPGGPEEIGRSRGWELEVLVRADNDNAAILTHGDFVADDGSPLEVYALPRRALEARLRCEAWALALQEESNG